MWTATGDRGRHALTHDRVDHQVAADGALKVVQVKHHRGRHVAALDALAAATAAVRVSGAAAAAVIAADATVDRRP